MESYPPRRPVVKRKPLTRRVKRGLLVTFEGIEGSGKTTQVRALGKWLGKRGLKVVLTREPGGTPLADRIRALLLGSEIKRMDPRMELFLYEVARRDHLSEVIRPALEKGAIVLCDRFTDATLAYQGYGRGLPIPMIESLNRVATGGKKPDVTFLFDLPVETGLERVRRRVKKPDRFDREKTRFHQRVRNGYLTLAGKETRRFKVIHARRPRKEVFDELCSAMEKFLSKGRAPPDRLSLRRSSRIRKGGGGR